MAQNEIGTVLTWGRVRALKPLLIAGGFLVYWTVGHSKLWGVDAPFGTGVAIAIGLGTVASIETALRPDNTSALGSLCLILLGLVGAVLLGGLVLDNPTGSTAKDIGTAVVLLFLPLALVATGLQRFRRR